MPATELVTDEVIVPVQVTVTEEPRKLSTHVVLPSPVNVKVPVANLPSAAILSLKSDLGHLMLMPPSTSWELTDLPVNTAPAGVRVAWAGTATTVSTPRVAATTARPRIGKVFIGMPSSLHHGATAYEQGVGGLLEHGWRLCCGRAPLRRGQWTHNSRTNDRDQLFMICRPREACTRLGGV